MAHGWGKKQFRCGDLHEGYYKEDKRSGFGIYIWVNGGMCVHSTVKVTASIAAAAAAVL
jgi:MORN repeat